MRRREFLEGVLAVLLGSTLSLRCARRPELAEALAEFYADPASAARVGAAVLRSQPGELDAEALVQAIAGARRAQLQALARSDPAGLARLLREQHRDDFAAGRVVAVEGWVLSRTEANLCALAALPNRT